MSAIAERFAANGACWMKSHVRRRSRSHPLYPVQAVEPEDLRETMCDALHEDATKRLLVSADEESYQLHVAFVRAHGPPQGEYTTFRTAPQSSPTPSRPAGELP